MSRKRQYFTAGELRTGHPPDDLFRGHIARLAQRPRGSLPITNSESTVPSGNFSDCDVISMRAAFSPEIHRAAGSRRGRLIPVPPNTKPNASVS